MEPIPHTLGKFACLDFVNSRLTDHLGRGEVHDRLSRPEWQRWFLDRWGVGPIREQPDLMSLSRARQTLRRVLEDWSAVRQIRSPDSKKLDAWLAAAPVRRRLDGKIEPVRRDWNWVLAEVVASVAEVFATREPQRLKTCANPGCSWMFWDESRNVSRRWCDARTCGNLITVREFRSRLRAHVFDPRRV